MSVKITYNHYILYGLNRYKNFLDEVGAENEIVKLADEQDVKEFCADMLHMYPCEKSAIFCVFKDGVMLAVIKIDDDGGDSGRYKFIASKDMHFFEKIDAEYRLCCYSLLCEEEHGVWRIER